MHQFDLLLKSKELIPKTELIYAQKTHTLEIILLYYSFKKNSRIFFLTSVVLMAQQQLFLPHL